MKKEELIRRITLILLRYVEKNEAEYLAEQIYKNCVDPAVEAERNIWVMLARASGHLH